MKKVLFATTALVLSAGVAAADVTLSGDARMGIVYNGANETTTQTQRARVQFKLAGEADNGLSFGTSFRVTANPTSFDATTAVGTAAVFISGAFGTLSFGPANESALAVTVHNTPHLGVLEQEGAARRSSFGPTDILYTYKVGDISVAASSGMNSKYAFGARFNLGDASVAVAQAKVGAVTQTSLSGAVSLAGVNLTAFTSTRTGNETESGLSAAYSMDATTITVRAHSSFTSVNSFGLGVTHNLGGGATLGAAIHRTGSANANANLGLSFSF